VVHGNTNRSVFVQSKAKGHDLQVGEGLRLDRKLGGKAVALGLPSLVVRGAEL
jgi:hypothetical protein